MSLKQSRKQRNKRRDQIQYRATPDRRYGVVNAGTVGKLVRNADTIVDRNKLQKNINCTKKM
jgi:hypothetical protein